MFSELKEYSVIWKGKQETGKEIAMSKAGKLKMNPVGVPKSTRPWHIFPWGLCRFRKLLTCSLAPKETAQGGCLNEWVSGIGLYFPEASRPNTDVPMACSDICACSLEGRVEALPKNSVFSGTRSPSSAVSTQASIPPSKTLWTQLSS